MLDPVLILKEVQQKVQKLHVMMANVDPDSGRYKKHMARIPIVEIAAAMCVMIDDRRLTYLRLTVWAPNNSYRNKDLQIGEMAA